MKKDSNSKSALQPGRLLLPLICMITMTAAISCKKKEDPIVEPPPIAPIAPKPIAEPEKQLSTCDQVKLHLNPTTAQKLMPERQVSIERHFQRVIRKGCQGEVLSDKIETVKSPTYRLVLQEPNKKPFKSVLILNHDTCANVMATLPISQLLGWAFPVSGDGKEFIRLNIDMASALLTLRVQEGLNRFFVEFSYDCSPTSAHGVAVTRYGDGTCESSKNSYLVEYPIEVQYSEKTLPGTSVINAFESDCRKVK